MTPDFTLIWPLSCLKDRVHLCTDVIEFHAYFYGAGDGDRTRDQRLGKP